jgi:DNA (cytosine-5)-methyltransferase 1
VDIRPQPRYPFEFVQADALEYVAAHGHEYDVIHASPPCHAYTRLRRLVEGKTDQLADSLTFYFAWLG